MAELVLDLGAGTGQMRRGPSIAMRSGGRQQKALSGESSGPVSSSYIGGVCLGAFSMT